MALLKYLLTTIKIVDAYSSEASYALLIWPICNLLKK
jgi:hypothetical protein